MLEMILALCIRHYSDVNNLEEKLVRSIIKVESNFKTDALSPDGEDIGLMQIRKKYVTETIGELYDSCTNIKVGTEILARVKRECKHKEDYTYVVCYNAGVAGGSRIKYPKKFDYYKKVMKHMRQNGKEKE